MSPLRVTTNFKDNNSVDLGDKLITKDYLISVYPEISQQIGIPPELWTWGFASQGQLGNNDSFRKSTPVTTFAGGTNWRQVSAGSGHVAAIKTDGTLWTWGFGGSGKLGSNQGFGTISTPITTFAGGTNWKQVSVGANHTAAVKTDGTLWTWGANFAGQIGIGNFFNEIFTPVTTFAGGTDWKQVSAGKNDTLALKTDGTLWSWGYLNLFSNEVVTPITTFAGGTNWADTATGAAEELYTISAGGGSGDNLINSAAIKTDGTLWTWGSILMGELGNGSSAWNNALTPITTFVGGTNWKQLSIGNSIAAAVKTDGTLWVWGKWGSTSIISGIDIFANKSIPTTIFGGGTNWADTPTTNPEDLYTISVGQQNSAAIKTDGTLWTWGYGNDGRLGNRDSSYKSTPVTTFSGGTNWKQINFGSPFSTHTIAIKTDGTLWTWGNNNNIYGPLGINEIGTNRFTPVTTFAGGTNWKQASSGVITGGGGLYSAAIKTDGTLWTWGGNVGGQLGTNGLINTSSILTPVTTFAGGTNWKQVSAGNTHVSAIKTDGTLWAWGRKSFLGILFPSFYSTPVTTFAGGTNWADTPTTNPEDLYTLSAGNGHSAAIKTDGTLWMWGLGSNGRLGNISTVSRTTPVTTFAGGTNWKQVSIFNHSAAVKTDGTLWTWGIGNAGQRGDNNITTTRNSPVTTFAGGTDWKQVSCGGYHTIAIKTDGTLWIWGSGGVGRLGTNDVTPNRSTPVTTFAGGTNWKQVSSGGNHTTAVKTDGTLWTWGYGNGGVLGTNDLISRSTPVTTFAGGTDWKQVSCNQVSTAAVKTDGTLWVWGSGSGGRLGNNDGNTKSTPVTTFAGGTNWRQVSVSSSHTVAVKTDGTLWTWGYGNVGQLGTNNINNSSTPITTFAGGTNWKQASAGSQYTLALRDDGVNKELFAFGTNANTQLGFDVNTTIPLKLDGTNWRQVSTGFNHTAAVKTDGTLWTWGYGSFGRLGTNDTTPTRSTPVTTFAGGTDWKQVSCGYQHTTVVKTDGTLWTWGYGNFGRLGTNDITTRLTPVTTFIGGTNWKQVSAGNSHTLALRDDGVNKELFAFGLGTNIITILPDNVPISLPGTTWKQVSSGSNHTAAVKTDGTLWTWGVGTSGELGINLGANRSTPVTTISGGTNWKQVSAGGNYTAAVKTDGTLWTWGFNSFSQLGTGDQLTKFLPVTTFAGGTDWNQVSCASQTMAAVKTDGTLWIWGYALYGDLGNLSGGLIRISTPITTFAGGTNWKQVSSGADHMAAVKTDGTLWTWGYGINGVLGDNQGSFPAYTPITTFVGGTNWKQVSVGNRHTIALQDDGVNKRLYTFGSKLGLGNNQFRSNVEVPITVFGGGPNWKHVFSSVHTTARGAIKNDGTLWTWGYSNYGYQIGILGNTNLSVKYISTPTTTFAGGTNWKQLSIGYQHAAAIKTDGTIWTWGNPDSGNLGSGGSDRVLYVSTPITTFAGGTNWADTATGAAEELYTISAAGRGYNDGQNFSAAIKTDGTLWLWGTAKCGQLGVGEYEEYNLGSRRFTPITTFAGGTNWRQVSSSYCYTAAIKTDGTLWTWGAARFRTEKVAGLGINLNFYRTTPVTTFAGGTNWKQVSCGYEHMAAVKTDGTLWTWGYEQNGKLGNNSVNRNIYTPVTTFAGGTDWKQVSCGGYVTAAIKTDGTLWTWGATFYSQIGNNGVGSNISTPVTTFAGGTDWKQVSCAQRHIAAIKTDGTLWTWGEGYEGELGNGLTNEPLTPVTTSLGGNNWKQVSCGEYFTAAVKTDGTLWTWGINEQGQLGTNDFANRLVPATTFAGGTNWKQVNCGYSHVLALKDTAGSKELFVWGNNYQYPLGNFNASELVSQRPVFGNSTNWKQVSCSGSHNVALKSDGTLWSWGRAQEGTLGTSDISPIRSTPVTTFAGGTNWKQATAGNSFTAAIRSVDF